MHFRFLQFNIFFTTLYFGNNFVELGSIFSTGSNDLTGVDIYNEDGELLTEGNVYSFNTNQYLECRPSDNSVVVPNYVWVKSIQYDAPGPNLIQNDNQMSGYNR